MLIQGQVGPASSASAAVGTTPNIRLGQLGDQVVSELHGRYYETNYRGALFTAFANAVTIASTHVTPLTANTGTPIISIYNPANSGKNISLVRMLQATVSGTPGGPLLWNTVPNPQNITPAWTQPTNNASLLQMGSVARCWNNTAVTASTAGVAFRTVGGMAASAVTGNILSFQEEYAGDLIIPPGSMLALCAYATGTSHIMSAFVEWEEIPI